MHGWLSGFTEASKAYLAAEEERNTQAMPMSHLRPMRPKGMLDTIPSLPSPGPSLAIPVPEYIFTPKINSS